MTTAVAESPVIRILGERKETTPMPVALGVSGQPIGPASTLGWDTAFAIKIRDVNAEMTKPGICPAGFEENVTGLCSAKGSFGPWKITVGDDGGDQGILRMTLPVTSGSLQFGGVAYAISNASALRDVE